MSSATAPAFSEFEQLVQQTMLAASCSREKAEAAVRLSRPYLVPSPGPIARAAEDILEKKEQQEIYKLFRAYGFTVRNLSQARASKQAPGLGDAFVTHSRQPIAFWWESKRQVGGKLSSAQLLFRDECERCGVPYHHGDRHAAAHLLVKLGLARVGNGPCGIVQFHDAR